MIASDYAVIAGGCFWCVEAIFRDIKGIQSLESGYTGGNIPNPTYHQVCSGKTGHAEAIRIEFDPSQIRYGELLDIHFATHDPTQLNQQGNDIGTQYRSAIFYHSQEQKQEAQLAIERAQKDYDKVIVTTIEPLREWYKAEDYHQDYWQNEGQKNRYCQAIIPTKLKKLHKYFSQYTLS